MLGIVCAGSAQAVEVRVMISGGFLGAYKALIPQFEKSSGHVVTTIYGPSMGAAPETIPNRLSRGEVAEVVIMAAPALDDLIGKNRVLPGSRTDLATSVIGMAVRAGARKPDISSVDAFRRALLEAKTIAWSDSASGVYLSTVLFRQLGVAEQMQGRRRSIPGEPAGAVVARGEAEIAFQQISELLPVAGIEIVGPIPDEIQQVTVFAAGIPASAEASEAARAFVRYLASPEAAEAIRQSGLMPVSVKNP
jgi:molybdate transport system substrate-binding protein